MVGGELRFVHYLPPPMVQGCPGGQAVNVTVDMQEVVQSSTQCHRSIPILYLPLVLLMDLMDGTLM